jgi:soluble lytic murein transglycosylase-like protein
MKKILLIPLLFLMLVMNVCISPVSAEVSEMFINAIITAESSYNSRALSKDGCRGLGQIKKETWYWVCDKMGVQWSFADAYDTKKNKAVTRFYVNWLESYLRENRHYSDELLFAAYNAGPGAVKKNNWAVPPYQETQHYIKKIIRILEEEKLYEGR